MATDLHHDLDDLGEEVLEEEADKDGEDDDSEGLDDLQVGNVDLHLSRVHGRSQGEKPQWYHACTTSTTTEIHNREWYARTTMCSTGMDLCARPDGLTLRMF